VREQREVMVLPTVGTAIGKYAGGLSTIPSCDLAAQVARETSTGRSAAAEAGHALFRNVIHAGVRDMHLSRLVAVSIEEVAFIGYDDATGDQHVAMWPSGPRVHPGGTSATSVGEPEPVSGIIIAGEPGRAGDQTACTRRPHSVRSRPAGGGRCVYGL